MIVEKTASEKAFQQKFVEELTKFQWEAPDELDGNKHKISVQTLICNWRNELNRLNRKNLEGVELTDTEFQQVLNRVNGIANSYEAGKLLSAENSTGKIDGIIRDAEGVKKKSVTLTIFEKAQIAGGSSSYKIAREVVSYTESNRFDLVLLINGLPLINVELKRTDKLFEETFKQFKRYYEDGEYVHNFMAFSQMMVCSSEIETKYFATPKSADAFNEKFTFNWSRREDNKCINDWREVISSFLRIPMAHQMVGDYLTINESKKADERCIMVLRPYQIYAIQAVEAAAGGYDTETKIPHGAVVWNSTGSGKTLTSFKTAMYLAMRHNFDKVIFLVDRTELDKNTIEKFEAYSAYEQITVDKTSSTSALNSRLRCNSNIVITTTYKMNNLVKKYKGANDDSLKDKKFVFIVDEAHRTTLGNMMMSIKYYFNNSLFFGFTGTPLFAENEAKGIIDLDDKLIKTTEELFGPIVSKYTMANAINDGNVLKFSVNYVNTGEFIDHADLRRQLIEKYTSEYPDEDESKIYSKFMEMSDAEIEYVAEKEKIFYYNDETHIPAVVSRILDGWKRTSNYYEFNAILTVARVDRIIAYYKEFSKQLKGKTKLNIAATFDSSEHTSTTVSSADIQMMIDDYSSYSGVKFNAKTFTENKKAYFESVEDRFGNGGSNRSNSNIDLMIVADKLLTGYDSKYINTLYVDRNLELQNLIQAYSRVNRVLDSNKLFGWVFNFKYPAITEEKVNKALKLYNEGGSSDDIIAKPYDVEVKDFNKKVIKMIKTLPNPTEWKNLQTDEEISKFVNAFIEASKQENKLEKYYCFQWDDKAFGIDQNTWLKYVGAFKNLTEKVDPTTAILPAYVLEKGGVTSKMVDEKYILNVISETITTHGGISNVDTEVLRLIYQHIDELTNMGEATKAELIRRFVEQELDEGNISSSNDFETEYTKWLGKELDEELKSFSDDWGVDYKLIKKAVDASDVINSSNIPYINEIINSVDYKKAKNPKGDSMLDHNIALNEELHRWIAKIVKDFSL